MAVGVAEGVAVGVSVGDGEIVGTGVSVGASVGMGEALGTGMTSAGCAMGPVVAAWPLLPVSWSTTEAPVPASASVAAPPAR